MEARSAEKEIWIVLDLTYWVNKSVSLAYWLPFLGNLEMHLSIG